MAKAQQDVERKRGTITRKGRAGVWMVRVFTGSTMVDGKRVKKYSAKVVHGTYRQAEQERTRMLGDLDKGEFIAPSGQTLAAYMANWLTTSTGHIAARTRVDYEYLTQRHIIPALGSTRLDRLHPSEIQALYNSMTAKGLGPRSVRYVHTVLKAALAQAVLWRQLPYNPADNIKLPEQIKTDYTILTAAQVGKLIAGTVDDHFYALWALLLNTGLRPQEALALKWDDLVGNKLHVVKALVKTGPGVYALGPTKTKTSNRVVSVPQAALTPLAAHRAAQAKYIMKRGSQYARDGFIFATFDGKIVSPANANRAWAKTIKRLNKENPELKLPECTLYTTRHTHASLLLDAGWAVKAVSERLGHASAKMTLDVYCHTMPETDHQTAAKFDELLLAATH